jgi:ABC-type Zn uptake system ZnuABC Zn-binding protein ZnuA
VVEEFAGEEPTPRELGLLVRAARRAGVSAILVEPQLPARVAQAIAGEFGGGTVLVDPLGDPRDPERDSYAELLRFDARAFAHALGGEAP